MSVVCVGGRSLIPTSWSDFEESGRLGGRKRKNKDLKAGQHGSTEAPIGHDHRPRWFVRGAECWKAGGCEKRGERGAKSGVIGEKEPWFILAQAACVLRLRRKLESRKSSFREGDN